MTTLPAHQIGATAFAATLDLDRSWSVLASVSGAIYIESDAEEILWVAANCAALHSRAILLAGMPAELPTAGTKCALNNGCLHVGAQLVVSLCDAEFWCPERQYLCKYEDVREAAQRTTAAIDQVALQSQAEGLLASIVFPNATDRGRSSHNAVDQELVKIAAPAVGVLRQAITGFDLRQRLQDAVQLVGLGRGLTPSGDDLLGGFLYTLHTLDSLEGGFLALDWEGVSGWLQQNRLRTNKISFAILADLACGDAPAPLDEFLNAALRGDPLEWLAQKANRVSAIGQSSGWDMLAGVYCACSVVEHMMIERDSAIEAVSHCGRMGKRELRQEDEHLKEAVHVW